MKARVARRKLLKVRTKEVTITPREMGTGRGVSGEDVGGVGRGTYACR
jgi:hypothetical protein